jgi:hypothetical protein
MLQMFDWRLYKKAATMMMARENPTRARVALVRETMTMARENPARAKGGSGAGEGGDDDSK